ncbi:hypothetical protein IMSAGC022_00730 [Alistipes sp.]|nr:hypothetical protein IMSAGC022_00730 [Alistipes sp.]
MLSVLPRYINTFKEESFKLWCNRERSNTSNVPEPLSRKTKGILGKSSGVISSETANLLCV